MYAVKSSDRNQLAVFRRQSVAPLTAQIVATVTQVNDRKANRTHNRNDRIHRIAMALAVNPIKPHGDEARVNISDRSAIDRLSAAFGCKPEDVYTAIATVGDRSRDVCKFLEELYGRSRKSLAPVSEGALLPPVWESNRS